MSATHKTDKSRDMHGNPLFSVFTRTNIHLNAFVLMREASTLRHRNECVKTGEWFRLHQMCKIRCLRQWEILQMKPNVPIENGDHVDRSPNLRCPCVQYIRSSCLDSSISIYVTNASWIVVVHCFAFEMR